ncbi:MAG: hypothetical protein G01um101472_301 [Parcubacteria group bacterium Gr01-1014_72]|nr:MAG: hypothetical protein G01um101472_301 [Parcubacteria group bacterium Gr01-1014_72]
MKKSLSYKTQPNIEFRQTLFWDVDPKTIDPEKHARYIIERILDFGEPDEVRWLFRRYPKQTIKEVMNLPRSQVHQKSKALWSLLLT